MDEKKMDEKKKIVDEIMIKMMTKTSLINLLKIIHMFPSNIINEKGTMGYTLLIYVAQMLSPVIVRELLKKGADVNRQSDLGLTPLMSAIKAILKREEEIFKMVLLLLEHNANPNIQDITGRTALMYAAEKNYLSIVELLLKKGAKVNIKDNEGHTAYNYTTNDDIKKVLRKHEDRMRDIYERSLGRSLPFGQDVQNKIARFVYGLRKPRKSVRKPRKSVRKPRKSVRKPRKSVRKPRKSVRK